MGNKNIISKIRRKNTLGWIIGSIVLFGLAVLILFMFTPKTMKYTFASKNVFSEPYDQLKVDHFYKGKTFYLYDWFAENSTGRFYLAPVKDANGDDGFIEVYIPSKYQDKANRIMNQTWEYMETGDKEVLVESISLKGYVKRMDEKSAEFLEQFCDDIGMSSAERATISTKMFVMLDPSEVYDSNFIGNMIMPVCLAIAGLCVLLYGLSGRYMRKLNKKMKQFGITKQDIDENLGNSPKVGNTLVGSKYILVTSGSPNLYKIEDVVWIYTQHVSQVNMPTQYYTTMFTRYHECVRLRASDNNAADSLCKMIHSNQPRALLGYNIENSTTYYSHFNELINMIYNQPAETEAPAAQAEPAAAQQETPAVPAAPVVPETPATPEAPAAQAPSTNDILTPQWPATPDILTPQTPEASDTSSEQDPNKGI